MSCFLLPCSAALFTNLFPYIFLKFLTPTLPVIHTLLYFPLIPFELISFAYFLWILSHPSHFHHNSPDSLYFSLILLPYFLNLFFCCHKLFFTLLYYFFPAHLLLKITFPSLHFPKLLSIWALMSENHPLPRNHTTYVAPRRVTRCSRKWRSYLEYVDMVMQQSSSGKEIPGSRSGRW